MQNYSKRKFRKGMLKYMVYKATWKKYNSGNDDPNRPTENLAFKNLRFKTKVDDWNNFIKQFEVM